MTLRPGDRPLFAQSESAVPDTYPGLVEGPKFDQELVAAEEATVGRLTPRQRQVARLSAHGLSPQAIAERLQYTPASVARLLGAETIQTEVQRYREAWDFDPTARIKDASSDSVDVLHKIVLDPDSPRKLAMEAAKFLVEKATGKAKQEVAVTDGSFLMYYEMLRGRINRGESLEVDVTPPAAGNLLPEQAVTEEAPDRWNSWLDHNL